MLEVGSAFRVPTFRNYTLVNPQVGSPRDLGVRHHLSHGWHWCEGSMWPSQRSFSQCVPQHYFLWTCVSSFQLWACSVLQLLSWVSIVTNQFINLEALLFPKRTDVSMPHGKTQLMLMCLGLNVALVKAPPSTNLQQDTVCIHKLLCRYFISFYHI